MVHQVSLFQALFSAFIWCVLLFVGYTRRDNAYIDYRSFIPFLLIGILFCTFGFLSGDFIHYWDAYDEVFASHAADGHMESIYIWLINNLHQNYFFWRFIVWGSALLLTAMSFWRLELPAYFSTLIFALVLAFYFPNPRQTLGWSILYLGFSNIMNNNSSRIIETIIGLILILISIYFHKSIFLFIGILFFASIPFFHNKYFYIISLLVFPLLYNLVYYLSSEFVTMFATSDQGLEGLRYLDYDDWEQLNWKGFLRLGIKRLPIIYIMVYSIINMYWREEYVPYVYKCFHTCAYCLIYISLLLWDNGSISAQMTTRFWDASLFPFTFFATYYLYELYELQFSQAMRTIKALIIANIIELSFCIYSVFSMKPE